MELKNKIALVTGSSSGIGQGIAIRLAQEGAKVVINYHHNQAGAEETARQVEQASAEYLIVQADVTKQAEVDKLFAEVEQKFGGLDVLVNNVGHYAAQADPLDIGLWQEQIAVNVFSNVMCSQKAVGLMQQHGGRIINVSSILGEPTSPDKDSIAYSAAKAAVASLTRGLALIVAPKILVNAVAPGFVMAPSWGDLSAQEEKTYGDQQLIKRFITAAEVADAVVFLAKNDAMAGEVLVIDGGLGLNKFRDE